MLKKGKERRRQEGGKRGRGEMISSSGSKTEDLNVWDGGFQAPRMIDELTCWADGFPRWEECFQLPTVVLQCLGAGHVARCLPSC